MKRIFALLMALPVGAQVSNPSIIQTTTEPATCPVLPMFYIGTSNLLYAGNGSGTCQQVNTGGSGSFNALTGDATSTATGGATTVKGINGTLLSSLASCVLFNTTTTGAISCATNAQAIAALGATPAINASAMTSFPTFNQNTTGNAATATAATNLAGGALGSAPYQNSAGTTLFVPSPTVNGVYSYGWNITGSAVAAPVSFQITGAGVSCTGSPLVCTFSGGTGSGTVSGQASGVIPLGTTSTSITGQSHCNDGNTTAGTVTCTEPITSTGAVTSGNPSGGVGSQVFLTQEGTVPTGLSAAGQDNCYADSTQHGELCNFNAGTTLPLVQGPASNTTGDVASFSGTNGGKVVDSSVVAANLVVASSPGVGVAHFAGSTQTVTSSTIATGDIAANAVTLAKLATQGANTVLANVTSGSAVPTAAAIPSGIQNYVSSTGYNQATGHQLQAPVLCADSSASGTVQSCTTSPSFTPAAGDCFIYTTTTANTGTGLTLNINALGAKSVAKWQSSTTLAANDVRANTYNWACYDGTNIELAGAVGNAPSGGSIALPQTIIGGSTNAFVYTTTTTNMTVDPNLTDAGGGTTGLVYYPGSGTKTTVSFGATADTNGTSVSINGNNAQSGNMLAVVNQFGAGLTVNASGQAGINQFNNVGGISTLAGTYVPAVMGVYHSGTQAGSIAAHTMLASGSVPSTTDADMLMMCYLTTASSTAGTLTITYGWTDNNQAQTYSPFSATVATTGYQIIPPVPFSAKSGAAITVTSTLVSGSISYNLDCTLEVREVQ